MRKTTEYKAENRLTVDIEGLMAMLSCGEVTAKKIADYAEARVIIGRRVLYNVDTLRHTGCTRLGENNVNPKVMQYVMGHSDAQITMNVYNHIAEKSHVENEMSKMNLPETVPAVV